jgi:cell division protein FtsB
MISIFNKDCKKKILQLELTIEHQQTQMDELRELVLKLSSQIYQLTDDIIALKELKYGKGI